MPRISRPPRTVPHAIRIIGGQYRRTSIPVVDAPGLRPTPDRVRETVFNWLNHFWGGEFSERSVLDPFAGTGAMGFEAASRGASRVMLVEADRRAAQAITALRDKLGARQIDVITGDALSQLRRLAPTRFDLICLDPPFGQGWLDKVWPLLPPVLADDGLVYVESDTAIVAPAGFAVLREDRVGAVHVALLVRAAPLQQPDQG